MKVALEHHEQIGETVNRVRVYQSSADLVLLEEGNTKGFDNPLHDLRLAGKSKVFEKHPHSLVDRQVGKLDVFNETAADLASKIINISDQLSNVRWVQSLQIFVQEL